MANKYLFSNLLLLASGEGGKTTSLSFAISYVAIEASGTLLEALIATLLSIGGTAKEAAFPMAIKLLIAVGSLFSCADGKQATPLFCASIGAHNVLL